MSYDISMTCCFRNPFRKQVNDVNNLPFADTFRIIRTRYDEDGFPHFELVPEWMHETHSAAEDMVKQLAAQDLSEIAHDAAHEIALTSNEEHVAIISSSDRAFPILTYDIQHIERKEFYDENSKKRYFYAYRDYKIYPNQTDSRFRAYTDMGFQFLRHRLDSALQGIDIAIMMAKYFRNHGR